MYRVRDDTRQQNAIKMLSGAGERKLMAANFHELEIDRARIHGPMRIYFSFASLLSFGVRREKESEGGRRGEKRRQTDCK